MYRSPWIAERSTRLVLGGAALALAGYGCGPESIAEPDNTDNAGRAAELATAATALTFYQVSAGYEHSCGVTSDQRAYCWGRNSEGELGDGTTQGRLTPVAVAGSLRFRQISAGFFSTCGVTTDNRAYCWGSNPVGELGDGTTTERVRPAAVAGGRQFKQVQTAFEHACAVTTTGGRIYCWGRNNQGQLGTGSRTGPQTGTYGSYSSTPVRVASTLTFRQVATGQYHTCAVTTTDRAFCWGFNRDGELGDSSSQWRRLKPTRVAGNHAFRQIDTERAHTCAVTTDNRAYCWGSGTLGQLGTGQLGEWNYPRAVSGGRLFRRITAGEFHTCAESSADRTWCWGANGTGQLGDGTDLNRLTPVQVVGGHLFVQVSAGGFHTCARTEAGVAYCWGRGFAGQLGGGVAANSLTPAPVAAAP
jgi:alpha-tubulin suppressor-like RCC1 family protein